MGDLRQVHPSGVKFHDTVPLLSKAYQFVVALVMDDLAAASAMLAIDIHVGVHDIFPSFYVFCLAAGGRLTDGAVLPGAFRVGKTSSA
jgi:hypothetical protein